MAPYHARTRSESPRSGLAPLYQGVTEWAESWAQAIISRFTEPNRVTTIAVQPLISTRQRW